MGSIGPTELLLIALVVLLIFGAGRVAEIGKGLGEGIRNFKKGIKDEDKHEEVKALPESVRVEKAESKSGSESKTT